MSTPRWLLACAVLVLGVVASSPVLAQCPGPCGPPGTPCPTTSLVPPLIVGGGACVGGITAVPYRVFVRDVNGQGVPGVPVELRFPVGAGTHGNQQQAPPQFVDCAGARLILPTNADGVAIFYPQFLGCLNTPSVQVVAAGVCLGLVRARSTDMAPAGPAVVDIADLNLFANAYLNKVPYQPCFDYNDNGIVDLPDLQVFAHDFNKAQPSAYCAPGW